VSAESKRHVSRALPTLLRLGRDAWLDEPRAPFDDPPHGVLGSAGFAHLMDVGFAELVLPGFDYVGVETLAARQWLASVAKNEGN
jgi:hypothetical protein